MSAGLVLDCSIAAAWFFEDEKDAHAGSVLDALANESAHVPPLWWTELGNVLLAGERRKRINTAKVAQGLSLLSALPIVVEHQLPNPETLQALARKQELSRHDATYLELAMRLGLALASKDDARRRAARRVGVALR